MCIWKVLAKFLLVFSLLFSHIPCFSQTRAIDSLSIVLKKELIDTVFIQTLNIYAFEYYGIDVEKMKVLADSAYALANKTKYDNGIATSSWIYGIYYVDHGRYDTALSYYLQSLKLYEKIGAKSGIARVYNLLGLLSMRFKDTKKALDYFNNSLQMYQAMQNQERIATCLNNIGLANSEVGKYEEAIANFSLSMKINQKLKMPHKVAVNYNDAGQTYKKQGNYDKALQFFLRALHINDSLRRTAKLPQNYINVAATFHQKKDYAQALQYYLAGIEKAIAIDEKEQIEKAYKGIAFTYSAQGDNKKAFEFYQLFHQLNDSMFNEKNSEKISNLQAEYQDEKQKSQILFLTKQKELQHEQKKFERIAFAVGLLLLSLFTWTQFSNSRMRKKVNNELLLKNEELNQKREEIMTQAETLQTTNGELTKASAALSLAFRDIEYKNANIISSINYAKRIQEAILPSLKHTTEIYPDSFVLFKPKDIVSGDFYYFSKVKDKVIIAAVDCTGHGVPGAFMSLIGNNLLKEIVEVRQETAPEKILEALSEGINNTLNQAEGEDNREGMDISICVIDKAKQHVNYAGAMNPIYFMNDTFADLQEIKADKRSIGGMRRTKNDPFKNHEIQLTAPNTTFYLFSDGFQDQFGGNDDKKYTPKRLKELLASIYQLPLDAQQNILEQTINQWQGKNKQIDDILVIGFSV